MDVDERLDRLEQLLIKIVSTQKSQALIIDKLSEDYLNRIVNKQDLELMYL